MGDEMGIYTITNTVNGKVYVGSTMNFKNRWGVHRSKLCYNSHNNSHLQSAWNKYGKGFFEFEVLEYLMDKDQLHLAEQFWMDVYRLEGKELYNYGPAAHHGMLGMKHTDKSRRKMSKSQKGRVISDEHRRRLSKARKGKENCAKQYPSFIHRCTGEIIQKGRNLTKMCRERGLTRSAMWRVVAGERDHHKDWTLLKPHA